MSLRGTKGKKVFYFLFFIDIFIVFLDTFILFKQGEKDRVLNQLT